MIELGETPRFFSVPGLEPGSPTMRMQSQRHEIPAQGREHKFIVFCDWNIYRTNMLLYTPKNERTNWVYIMTNRKNGTIYTGSTSDIASRVIDHKTGRVKRFYQEI